MRLISLFVIIPIVFSANVRIDIERLPSDVSPRRLPAWDERGSVPEPILTSFAEHLNSMAGLFSSFLGNYQDPQTGKPSTATTNQKFSQPCKIEESDNHYITWAGPYCLINYDQTASCSETFNCLFHHTPSELPSSASLCCQSSEKFSEKFSTTDQKIRLFIPSSKQQLSDEKIKIHPGHYGLSEIIFNSRNPPSSILHLNKFDMGNAACALFGEENGYYKINPLPDYSQFYSQISFPEKSSGFGSHLCAKTIKYTENDEYGEIPSIMPFCTFKFLGQPCPNYAPLHLRFPAETNSSFSHLPEDRWYESETFLDTSGFCCSLTNQLTVDQTEIDMNYLPRNFSMNDFQVIKWPYADCPRFKFPEMKLIESSIEMSGLQVYPWEKADMSVNFCTYKKAVKEVVPEQTTAAVETTVTPIQTTNTVVVEEDEVEEGSVGVEKEVKSALPQEIVVEDFEEQEYQTNVVNKLASLHTQYQNISSDDKYQINPFDTTSNYTKLFRSRRAGCYFSTDQAYCRGDSVPFLSGLQICCDQSAQRLKLSTLWEEPYPENFFTLRGDQQPCKPVESENNDMSIIRQEVKFKYENDLMSLNGCVYTIIPVNIKDMDDEVNEKLEVMTTPTAIESRALLGFIKTTGVDCPSSFSMFKITQDTEDHPTNIANCSESWTDNVLPELRPEFRTDLDSKSSPSSVRMCSQEGHGLVTWEFCMGDRAQVEDGVFGLEEPFDSFYGVDSGDNVTYGFCYIKAAIVTCLDGYTEKYIRWQNEQNGNQNTYRFGRSTGNQQERIWPGGYFGSQPELQINVCCRHVENRNVTEIKSKNDDTEPIVIESESQVEETNTTVVEATNEVNPELDSLVYEDEHDLPRDISVIDQFTDGVIEEPVVPIISEYTLGLLRFGDRCPLSENEHVKGPLEAWFDFPTEKDNTYDATGDVAEKSDVGIKLFVCLYGV